MSVEIWGDSFSEPDESLAEILRERRRMIEVVVLCCVVWRWERGGERRREWGSGGGRGGVCVCGGSRDPDGEVEGRTRGFDTTGLNCLCVLVLTSLEDHENLWTIRRSTEDF